MKSASASSSSLSTPPTVRRTSFSLGRPTSFNDIFQMKVMRLASPVLFNQSQKTGASLGGVAGGAGVFPLTSQLVLASISSMAYLGEEFRTCISLTHKLDVTLQNVVIRVEIQTHNQRLSLLDTSEQHPQSQRQQLESAKERRRQERAETDGADQRRRSSVAAQRRESSAATAAAPVGSPKADGFEFPPNETRDFVLNYRISELEPNNLVCVVEYDMDDGERHKWQKYFVINVSSPFDIETVMHQREDVLFAELSITNHATEPMLLDSVKFEPSPLFVSKDLNVVAVHAAQADEQPVPTLLSTFGDVNHLDAGDAKSFLFRVRTKNPLDRTAFSAGHFRLQWRSELGKLGVLVTDTLGRWRNIHKSSEIALDVIESPENVWLERPFGITIEITNMSRNPLNFRLDFDSARMSSILPCRLASQALGTFEPKVPRRLNLTLIALALGVQSLSGLTVSREGHSRVAYKFDDVFSVLVQRAQDA